MIYVNEAEYHQAFINSVDSFPLCMKSHPEDKVLVWAHELRLFDAGTGGGDGKADILTVDEHGFVWLIEAKMYNSAELNGNIWNYQISRYRKALMNISWNHIHRYIKSFIRGNETTKPQYDIFNESDDLIDVIARWQKLIGRQILEPNTLIDIVAKHLKDGTFGIAVLAEIEEKSVYGSAVSFCHKDGPVAYIRAVPGNNGLFMDCTWIEPKVFGNQEYKVSEKAVHYHFDEYDKKKRKIEGSIYIFKEGLCDGAKNILEQEIEPALIEFGWDGIDTQKNQKSVTVALPVGCKRIKLLQLGWSDTDSKIIKREHKNIGTAGFKLDINFYLSKNEPFSTKDNIERWCKEFYEIGWRGKGGGQNVGIRRLTDQEYQKWGGKTMVYKPNPTTRDFVGNSEEREAIRNFFIVLKKIIGEMEDILK